MDREYAIRWFEQAEERYAEIDKEISDLGKELEVAEFRSRVLEKCLRHFKTDQHKETRDYVQMHVGFEDKEYSEIESKIKELMKEKSMYSAIMDELRWLKSDIAQVDN